MFAQRLAIQLRRLLEQRIQTRIDLLDPRAAFSWNLDVGDGRQSLDGLDELHPVVLHQEGDRRAAGATAETLVTTPFRTDVERGGLLLVEGAAGLVGLAGLGQFYAGVDQVDDVDPLKQIVDEGLRNTTSHWVVRLPLPGCER